ncbi:type II CRISPR RNA-guided endonuclease Cas9 [Flavobacterium granuli]|uniref:CRISPR-associated endonuclease Cas9 n=1 Tax=Flavobacterium granuli TaxID=280093 RepID=A0A1M5SB09_9FLAO|nr:type II CRISPR RNA-guided endonuclease Cas9 [Flavobacterium granuli]PRZ21272.1 CRISPR-associated endonuclease Csn1 [Flavobacterium granuli]SHH35630.1 CRISPR-associated endonuclease Csn1 [Flavobacterium granuli]
MNKILGLNVDVTTIGWAFINEAQNENEVSKIIDTGVRIVSLSSEEENDFKKGKSISINTDRTLKRAARRGLQRFKQRRTAILEIFNNLNFISDDFIYSETGKQTTFSSYELRAKSASEAITKEELVKVLLMLNKKRGYKSNRKLNVIEDGEAVDAMILAKELFEHNLTPGQWVYKSLSNGNNHIPDFYRSDLQNELEKIVKFQKQFHSQKINNELLEEIKGKSRTLTSQHFNRILKIELAENQGTKEESKLQHYKWRNDALDNALDLKVIAFIITEINNQINQSSGYLGAISDRSKELHFNKETVGQFQYKQLQNNAHSKLKNQVFYRQDYLDEFDKIWETQAKFHPELNDKLKAEVRDITIFYQRKLKSQKHLINHCEFEKGHKAIPKSSPLFQEFRIWQNLNNIVVKNETTKELFLLEEELKQQIAEELQFKENMTDIQLMAFCGLKKGSHSVNFKKIEGNRTNTAIYKAFEKILEVEGYQMDFSKMSPFEIKEAVFPIFETLKITTNVFNFDSSIQGNEFDKQPYYQLWHLLYSCEEDEPLKKTLMTKFGFKENHIPFLLNINLQSNYGSLSAKAIKKVLPHLMDGQIYDQACLLSGYNHSSSLTTEQNHDRILKDSLDLIKKNSLRNPVVEKILNQMINVINAIIADPSMGRPDEIRVELARELKKNNNQRNQMNKAINKSIAEHDQITKFLQDEFKILKPTRNDIIRYKLWKESEGISLYTGKPIKVSKLFSNEYDIDHIIPKSRLFDDSYSNKTICERQLNIYKNNRTAFSFLQETLSPREFSDFQKRVENLFGKISPAKQNKLLMSDNEIPEGFIDRQLKEAHHIVRNTKKILLKVSTNLTITSSSITTKLQQDWELLEVMKELNWEKYNKLDLTITAEGKNGKLTSQIKEWNKHYDLRHHALNAITIAFTKPYYIERLNNLSTRHFSNKITNTIATTETKYLEKDHINKLFFTPPIKNIREETKKHLINTLISYKTKNRVLTSNKNIAKSKNSRNEKIQFTPRGQLHKETVYGKIQHYDTNLEKIGAHFTALHIANVAKKKYRDALLVRLAENNNNPKKAFTGKNALAKNPILLASQKNNIVPEKVKMVRLKDKYTIRKDITPTNFKDLKSIEKVIDPKIKQILLNRLKHFNDDPKKAFSNLEDNPIWLYKEKKITIKRCTISGVSSVQALHTKKDHLGNEILDENNNPIPSDFVSPRNNHHVSIYKDEKGKIQEEVVSFYDAVVRKNSGISVVNKNHEKGWEFLFSMKQNEFFIFPTESFNPHDIDLKKTENYHLISPNIFRVQKIAKKNYLFRHHSDPKIEELKDLKDTNYKTVRSTSHLQNIIKIQIDTLGKIIHIGEY